MIAKKVKDDDDTMPRMADFVTDGMRKAMDEMRDMGDLDKAAQVADEEGCEYYGTIHEGTVNPIFHTEYTHDSALGIIPERLRLNIQFMRECHDWFNNAPSMQRAEKLVWAHPRPQRFMYLKQFDRELATENYRKTDRISWCDTILDVYIDTEIFDEDYANEWAAFLTKHETYLNMFTMPFKSEAYPQYRWCSDALGGQVTLYHGVEYGKEYLPRAWTLSPKVARFFAQRFASEEPRQVYRTVMPYDEVCNRATFYTNRRNEEEVYFLIPPATDQIEILDVTEVFGEDETA